MTTPLSEAARAMGRARSARKAAASRANGKLGGRPRMRSAPHSLQERCLLAAPASVLVPASPKEGQ